MAATATPTTNVREDAPAAPEVRDPTPTAAQAPGTNHTSLGGNHAPLGGFDDLFVQPVDPQDDRGSLPTLPSGWRHAGLVQLVARQPRERRETILAGGFALAAVLWAPLGVLAFMTRNALVFGILSLVAAILAVAPRPHTGLESVGEAADGAGTALDGVGPAIASARERLARVGSDLHGRLGPVVPRVRDASARVVVVLRDVGNRVADGLRSADRSVSAAVRRGLEGLQGGGGDHNSPSSAR